MRDGRDDVCEVSKRPSPSTRIVTGVSDGQFYPLLKLRVLHLLLLNFERQVVSKISIFKMSIFKKCNADLCIIVPTFSTAPSAVSASQSPISIFDSPNRLSKVLWGYWRRTASNSGSPSRLVCRSPYRCKPIIKPIKGAHHITGGEPCVYDPLSSEGSEI